MYQAQVRYTPQKDRQVARKTKTYTIAEIIQAMRNRRESTWHIEKGILGVWDKFWEHGDKVEEFLNRKQEVQIQPAIQANRKTHIHERPF